MSAPLRMVDVTHALSVQTPQVQGCAGRALPGFMGPVTPDAPISMSAFRTTEIAMFLQPVPIPMDHTLAGRAPLDSRATERQVVLMLTNASCKMAAAIR